MDGLDQEPPLGDRADEPTSDRDAWWRATIASQQALAQLAATMQVWAARRRGPLSEEAAQLAQQLHRQLWLCIEASEGKAPLRVRPEGS